MLQKQREKRKQRKSEKEKLLDEKDEEREVMIFISATAGSDEGFHRRIKKQERR